MLPREQLSLTPVARTAPVQSPVDPRQQAFQRAIASMVGQSMQAEVLSKLPDGNYLVRVADMAARMPLPAGAQPGTQVPMTLVALNPRPTFQVQTAQGGAAFAEAAAEEAAAHGAPLAYLQGKEAAALTRTAALLASAQTIARMPGGAGGDGASLSAAGKTLGDIVAAAQNGDTQATAATGRAPLLAAASADAGRIAGALRDGLAKSGLFYESHVAEWAAGTRTLGDLAGEPQARGMPAPTDPATAQFINLQLNAHEQARVAWQGQLWPGQEMRWEVERAPEDGKQGKGGDGAEGGATWQSRLLLRFGALGEVSAKVVLAGDQLHIRLDTDNAAAGTALDGQRARLAQMLEAAGMPLSTLAIHQPSANIDGNSGDGEA